MAKITIPSTPAIRLLKEAGVPFSVHTYRYEEKGGTAVAAEALGVDEHAVLKTLVMEDEIGRPLVVVQHGDREVSTKALARQIGARSVQICKPEVAQKHSGYLVGGTSPFGTRKPMPVHVEESVFILDQVYINGGSRGVLVALSPSVLESILGANRVSVGLD